MFSEIKAKVAPLILHQITLARLMVAAQQRIGNYVVT